MRTAVFSTAFGGLRRLRFGAVLFGIGAIREQAQRGLVHPRRDAIGSDVLIGPILLFDRRGEAIFFSQPSQVADLGHSGAPRSGTSVQSRCLPRSSALASMLPLARDTGAACAFHLGLGGPARLLHAGPDRSRLFSGGEGAIGFRKPTAPRPTCACALCDMAGDRAGFLKLKEADPPHQLQPVVLYVADPADLSTHRLSVERLAAATRSRLRLSQVATILRPSSINAILCGGSPSAISHPRRTASITATSASKFLRPEALAIGTSNRNCRGWSPEERTSSAHNARVRESAAIQVRSFAMPVNGLLEQVLRDGQPRMRSSEFRQLPLLSYRFVP
jgi:hypothetical protein